MSADTNSPAYQCAAYLEMRPRWELIRRVRNLNESIENDPDRIIPKGKTEGLNNYETRKKLTFGFEALDETIASLVGLGTRHPPELGDDVPERIRSDWEDIDLRGTHGDVFVQESLDASLQDGHGAILVDYPPAPPDLTLEQEQRLGLRAYMVRLSADQIDAWHEGRVLGRWVPTMVKIKEEAHVDEGFGYVEKLRYRVLRQAVEVTEAGDLVPYVTFEVHEEMPKKGRGKPDFAVIESGRLRGPKWIPVHPFYGGEKRGLFRSRPPLRGMAYANLEHTQLKSARAYSMHKTAIAIPVWIGRVNAVPGEVIQMNSDTGIDVVQGGDAKFMEGAGNALAPLREDRMDIERLMGSMGYSMIRRDAPVEQTATETELKADREESKLARAIRSLNDALEAAFGSMAAFYGEPDGGSITMERSFRDITLTVDEIRVLNDMESEGKLTWTTLMNEIRRGGRLLQRIDVKQEEIDLNQSPTEPVEMVA